MEVSLLSNGYSLSFQGSQPHLETKKRGQTLEPFKHILMVQPLSHYNLHTDRKHEKHSSIGIAESEYSKVHSVTQAPLQDLAKFETLCPIAEGHDLEKLERNGALVPDSLV